MGPAAPGWSPLPASPKVFLGERRPLGSGGRNWGGVAALGPPPRARWGQSQPCPARTAARARFSRRFPGVIPALSRRFSGSAAGGGAGGRGWRGGRGAGAPPGSLQAVGAEGILDGGVGEQRAGVAQHAQPVQRQRLDAQLLLQPPQAPQRPPLHLEARDPRQRRGDLLGQPRGGVACGGEKVGRGGTGEGSARPHGDPRANTPPRDTVGTPGVPLQAPSPPPVTPPPKQPPAHPPCAILCPPHRAPSTATHR